MLPRRMTWPTRSLRLSPVSAPGTTRTRNLPVRSWGPYPLGDGGRPTSPTRRQRRPLPGSTSRGWPCIAPSSRACCVPTFPGLPAGRACPHMPSSLHGGAGYASSVPTRARPRQSCPTNAESGAHRAGADWPASQFRHVWPETPTRSAASRALRPPAWNRAIANRSSNESRGTATSSECCVVMRPSVPRPEGLASNTPKTQA